MKNININYTAVTGTRGAALSGCLADARVLAIETQANVQLTHNGHIYWIQIHQESGTVFCDGVEIET